MDFFGIGFGEVVLILVLALIVFGPGRLPEIARTVGRFSRSLKRMSSDFTTALTKEIDLEEEQNNLKKISSELKTDVKSALNLNEQPRSHLDPNKAPSPEPQTQPPENIPANDQQPSTRGVAQPESNE